MTLSKDEIQRVVDLVVEHDLANPETRGLLFAGVDAHLTSLIDTSRKPKNQVELDLLALAGATAAPGEKPPAVIWLENLARHMGPTNGAKEIQALADRLHGETKGSREAVRFGVVRDKLLGALTGAVDVFRELDQAQQAELISQHLEAVRSGPSVAVVGRYSSGKTTFVNALLGEKLLTVRHSVTTASMVILQSDTSDRTIVTRRTEEQNQRDAEHLEQLKAKHQEGNRHEDRVALERLNSYRPPPAPRDLDELIEQANQGDADALRRCWSEGEDSIAAHIASVHLNRPFDPARVPRGAAIIDTPGVDSPYVSHRLVAWGALRSCDCVILLLKPDASVGEHEMELLEAYLRLQEHRPTLGTSLLFVVGSIDRAEDDHDRGRLLQSLREQLHRYRINADLVPCSPLMALLGDIKLNGGSLKRREEALLGEMTDDQPDRAWAVSGMPAVLDRVWRIGGMQYVDRVCRPALERTIRDVDAVSAELGYTVVQIDEGTSNVEQELSRLEGISTALEARRMGFLDRCDTIIQQRMDGVAEAATLQEELTAVVRSCNDPDKLEKAVNTALSGWVEQRCVAIEYAVDELAAHLTREAAARFAQHIGEGSAGSIPRLHIEWSLASPIDLKMGAQAEAPADPFFGAILGLGIGSLISEAAAWIGAFLGLIYSDEARKNAQKRRATKLAHAREKLSRIIPQTVHKAQADLYDERERLSRVLMDEVRYRVDAWLGALRARCARTAEELAQLRAEPDVPTASIRKSLERVAAVQSQLREASEAIKQWRAGDS